MRSHSHCGYLSPTQHEKEYYASLDEKAEALAEQPNSKKSMFNLYFFLT